MGIIKQLYFGNVNPQTRYVKKGSAAQRAMEKLSRSEAELQERLCGKDRELLDDYGDAWSDVLDDSCLDSFVVGFRLGARFAVDMFLCEDAPFKGAD